MKEFVNKKLQKFFPEDYFPEKGEGFQNEKEKEVSLYFC